MRERGFVFARRFARLVGCSGPVAGTPARRSRARVPEKAQVVGVERYTGKEVLIAASRQARAILTKAEEVNFLSGPAAA